MVSSHLYIQLQPVVRLFDLDPAQGDLRWFDVPATQVELDNRQETLHRVFDFGHGEEGLRMCHEAAQIC